MDGVWYLIYNKILQSHVALLKQKIARQAEQITRLETSRVDLRKRNKELEKEWGARCPGEENG